MNIRAKDWVILFSLLCGAWVEQLDAQTIRAGSHHPVDIETPSNYGPLRAADTGGPSWSKSLCHRGATFMAVHFKDFSLGQGDYLLVSDAKGGQNYVLTGKGKRDAGTFWGQHVKGDTIRLQLFRGGTSGSQGFTIDQYSAGEVAVPAIAVPESVCGNLDDKANAKCYEYSQPTVYAKSRAVARLLVHGWGGSSWGTGFLVSPNNHVLTARHVVSDASDVLNTDIEFMAETPNCTVIFDCEGCYSGTVYSGANLVASNPSLDYTLMQIVSGQPSSAYGYLELEPSFPPIGEQIYIPQYANANAKQIAFYSTHDGDSGGVCRVHSLGVPSCEVNLGNIGYYADTEGGSSGSPVISMRSQKVIAMHECGGCMNSGVPAYYIYKDLQCIIGPAPELGAALDAPWFNWTTGGDAPWIAKSCFGHDGVDSAQSGRIYNGQRSWLKMTVNGPGQISFWWKVSSEANYDLLNFYIDDSLQTGISGEISWQLQQLYVPPGLHVVTWAYEKDSSSSAGKDRAWLDQVSFGCPLCGVLNLSATNYSVSEAGGVARVAVQRTGNVSTPVSVNFDTKEGSAYANQDYISVSTNIYFGAYETNKVVAVPIVNNCVDQPNRSFSVRLTSNSDWAKVGAGKQASVKIIDEDSGGELNFSKAAYSASERNGEVEVIVTRSNGLACGVTVRVQAFDRTATNGVDYLLGDTVLVFSNQASCTIAIPIAYSPLAVGDKKFVLRLTEPAGGARLGVQTNVAVKILESDVGLQFSRAVFTNKESAGTAILSVVRTGPTNQQVWVDYFTQDGTASSSSDYGARTGQLIFAPGVNVMNTAPIAITNDTVAEGPESFAICLVNPGGGAILGSQSCATVLITDNDLGGTISFSQPQFNVSETCRVAKVSLVRTLGLASGVTVMASTSDMTGTNGIDYLGLVTNLTFAANQTNCTLRVPILDDALAKGNKRFLVSLSAPTGGAKLGALTNAVVAIQDNEVGLCFSRPSYTNNESAGKATAYVLRTGPLTNTVWVDYYTRDGSASSNSDYRACSGRLVFPPGAYVTNITLKITNDTLVEGMETFEICLARPGGGALLGTVTNTLMVIVDDDGAANGQMEGEVRFSAISQGPVGSMRLELQGPRNGVVEIQASPDLRAWQTLETLTNATGVIEWTDPGSRQGDQWFYRGLLVNPAGR